MKYSLVKKNYNYEKYLSTLENANLRRNITNIRISTHKLPIELLRRADIKREYRVCKLCNSNEIGSEFHTIVKCKNPKVISLRQDLNKISSLNQQWKI